MKNFSLIILSLLTYLSLSAQDIPVYRNTEDLFQQNKSQRWHHPFNFKPYFGMALSRYVGSNTGDFLPKPGIVGGVDFEYHKYQTRWAWAVGLGYSFRSTSTKTRLYPYLFGTHVKLIYKIGYIDVPVMAHYLFAPHWRLKAGVLLGFRIHSKVLEKITETNYLLKDQPLDNDLQPVDLSIPVGVSYEWNNLELDLRYQIGLNNMFSNQPVFDEYEQYFTRRPSIRHSWFTLTVGYRILR